MKTLCEQAKQQPQELLAAAKLENGVFLAAQCCAHLNRALVVEEDYRRRGFRSRPSEKRS